MNPSLTVGAIARGLDLLALLQPPVGHPHDADHLPQRVAGAAAVLPRMPSSLLRSSLARPSASRLPPSSATAWGGGSAQAIVERAPPPTGPPRVWQIARLGARALAD